MNRRWLLALAAVLVFGYHTKCNADSNLYEVLEVAYCKKVVTNTPVGIFNDAAIISPKHAMYCWTRIRVLPDGVKMLRSLGRLPVRHIWIHDGLRVFTAPEPSITSDQWEKNKEKIEWMISESEDGTFEWRTASLARNDLKTGFWRVIASDANGRQCRFRNANEFPSIRIEIKELN